MTAVVDLALVTGAAGWLGRRLVEGLAGPAPAFAGRELLGRPLRVRCLIRPGEDAAPLRALSGVEVVVGDLRDPAACLRLCAGAEGAVLFHTAGVIHPARVREFRAINEEGTLRMLEAAADASVRRAVVVSSNSPLGVNPHRGHLFDEDSPYRPYMGYGRSKMRMELRARALGAAGRIEIVLVRPPWFYGPDQPARQTLFFQLIRRGRVPVVGGGENLRSMVYLDNLCQGLIRAAVVEGARGRTYWIADRRPYAMNEILDTVERLLEEEFDLPVAHRRVRLPGVVGAIAQLADGALQRLGLYHQKIHVLSEMDKDIACSVARAEAELGYRPEIALEEGMRRSIASCLARGLAL